MKKFTTISIALCLVFAMALPAMAATAEFDGHLRVRGFTYQNNNFSDSTGYTDSKYDTRFRTNFRFNVSDELWVRGRFHAWSGGYDLGTGFAYTSTATASVDRGWLAYKTPFGLLEAGRMNGGSWGTAFGDFDGDFDRIKFTTKVGDKLAVIAIIQKTDENDYGTAVSDNDTDTFYLAFNYAAEKFSAGLLNAYSRVGGTRTPGGPSGRIDKFAMLPYIKGNFGPIGLEAEVSYEFGQVDMGAAVADKRIDAWTLMGQLSGNHGMFGWEGGWAYVRGQDTNENNITAANTTYGGLGQDWDKFVYFSDTQGRALLNTHDFTQAAAGTLSAEQLRVIAGGVNTWWLGFNLTPKEFLKLSFLVGNARALESDGWIGADYGTEYDFRLVWNVVDNLDYYFNFGYVAAGDGLGHVKGYTQATKSDLDDGFKCYHKLQLNF